MALLLWPQFPFSVERENNFSCSLVRQVGGCGGTLGPRSMGSRGLLGGGTVSEGLRGPCPSAGLESALWAGGGGSMCCCCSISRGVGDRAEEYGRVRGLGFGLTRSCLQACSSSEPQFTLLSLGSVGPQAPQAPGALRPSPLSDLCGLPEVKFWNQFLNLKRLRRLPSQAQSASLLGTERDLAILGARISRQQTGAAAWEGAFLPWGWGQYPPSGACPAGS